MSRNFDKKFTLPLIESKPPKKEDSENYNFIKQETKKSRTSFKDIPPPQEDQDDLRNQVMRLKKELDQRTQSVMALQRNFESLSTMFKTEKSETQRFKNEAQSLRDTNSIYQQKIKDLEGKLDEMTGKLVKGQQDNEAASEKVSQMNKTMHELTKANKRISELESIVEQRNTQNADLNLQIRELNVQMSRISNSEKNFEKEKKQYQQEIQTLKDQNQQLIDQKEDNERQKKLLEENLDKAVYKINELQSNTQDSDILKEDLLENDRKMKKEIQTLKQKESDLLIQLKKLENVHESQQTMLKMKQNNENQYKQESTMLKELNKELQDELKLLREERGDCRCAKYLNLINNYEEMKTKCQDEIILIAKFEQKNNQQICKELRENVQIMSSEIQSLRQKLSDYEGDSIQQIEQLKEMLEKEKKIKEMLKDDKSQIQNALNLAEDQRNSLQNQLEQQSLNKDSELNKQSEQNKNLLYDLNQYEEQKNMLEKEKQNYASMLKVKDSLIDNLQKELNTNQIKIEELILSTQMLKQENTQYIQSTKSLEEQNKQLSQNVQQISQQNKELKENLNKLSSNSKDEQNQITSMSNQITELKERMEQEILNSQALNKSHKELILMVQSKEIDLKKVKQEYEEKIQSLSNNKRNLDEEIKNLKESYDKTVKELNQTIIQKDTFLNSSLDYQIQIDKLKVEKEEIQRSEQKKDSQIYRLDLEIKTLTNKLSLAERNLEELDPVKIKQQITDLKDKERLLRSSVAKIENAAQAAEAQFGCNHCGQIIKEARTCAPCGHSYCDTCVKGYTPYCQECKKPNSTELILQQVIITIQC